MIKFLVTALFVMSIGITAWTINDYATSGEPVLNVTLPAAAGTLPPIELDPSMSPVRAFLRVKFEIHLQDMHNDAYLYDVVLTDPAGSAVLSEKRTHTEKQEDRGAITEQNISNHILGTFDVPQRGIYLADWRIKGKQAKIKEVIFELRRNVTDINLPFLALAAGCFVLAFIILLSHRRRAAP